MYDPRGSGKRRGAGLGTWLAAGAALAAILVLIGIAGRLDVLSTGGGGPESTAGGELAGGELAGGQAQGSDDDAGGGDAGGGDAGGGDAGGGEPAEPPEDEESGDGTSALTFSLDLEGAVPYADNVSVSYSIDGRKGIHGFCGFSENTLCRSDRLYSFTVPSVATGAAIEWHFVWGGSTELTFGHGSTPSHAEAGASINYRCVYRPSDTSDPRPTCSPA